MLLTTIPDNFSRLKMRRLTLKLTPRADGRVCKRINGQLQIWPDEATARSAILAMIALQEQDGNAAVASAVTNVAAAATARDVANAFITDREQKMKDGQIEIGTFLDYKDSIDAFTDALDGYKPANPDVVSLMGRRVPVAALEPHHFKHCRDLWDEQLGSHALARRIQGIRTAFKWAAEIKRLIPGPPHYGDQFSKPTKADHRADRRGSETQNGEHRFEVVELGEILACPECVSAMKCFVLLGLNGGMYAADCAVLRFTDIKREGKDRIIDTYREKTQIRQKFVLWPETVKAIDAWKAIRPKPKNEDNADLVFITAHGLPWISESIVRDDNGLVAGGGEKNSITLMFNRMLDGRSVKIGRKRRPLKRPGVGFGAFRHTHISATAIHPDANARKVVRGHKIDGIEEHYDFQDITRLKAVTDIARRQLLLPAISSKKQHGKKQSPAPSPSDSPDRSSAASKNEARHA